MSRIHPSAVVSPKAELADDVTVGPFTYIQEDVIVESGSVIGSSVQLAPGARRGKNVKIFQGAVIATVPQDLKFGGEITTAEIGDGTTIREYVTVNRGTEYHNKSVVGKNCLIMAYAHVAHDCLIGDNVIMANSVNLAGHVEIDDNAIIGGLVPVHQFVKIGAHCMVGGGFRVQQDIVPYSLSGGYPIKIMGLNAIGLKRRGFSKEAITSLQQAYKLLFGGQFNTSQAVEKIKAEVDQTEEVQTLLKFIERSDRGIVK
jgi:UDP-N-acetylglucosamine acyltransferase